MQTFYNSLAQSPTSWQAQFTTLSAKQIEDMKKTGREWTEWPK